MVSLFLLLLVTALAATQIPPITNPTTPRTIAASMRLKPFCPQVFGSVCEDERAGKRNRENGYTMPGLWQGRG